MWKGLRSFGRWLLKAWRGWEWRTIGGQRVLISFRTLSPKRSRHLRDYARRRCNDA
jgi:hypothetical protein